jgi:ABC-type branched-subunit amino acid transport system substrate-binding protein
LRRLKTAIVAGVAVAALASAGVTAGTAGAQGQGKGKEAYIIGNIEIPGDSALAQPQFNDGALLGVASAKKAGRTINYERIPAGSTNAAIAEQAFLASAAKNPDLIVGLTSSNVFIPVGPKVAASGVPTIALASPSEGVKDGTSGGDNIFLIRPLNEQTYSSLLEFICTDLKKELKEKEMKIALNLVQTAFGSTVEEVVNREIGDYKGCSVVNVNRNSAVATDMTQQVLAIKDSGANVIMSANFPNPSGVFVNQLRQNGVTIPFVGGASLNLAVDAGSIQNVDNLWASDDCVPELEKDKKAKKFVKDYTAEYGYVPNYASAQLHDIMMFGSDVIAKAGNDRAAIIKGLSNVSYDGVCDFQTDANNLLGTSVTIYKYKGGTDKTKVLEKKVELQKLREEDIVIITTAPPTTAAPAG